MPLQMPEMEAVQRSFDWANEYASTCRLSTSNVGLRSRDFKNQLNGQTLRFRCDDKGARMQEKGFSQIQFKWNLMSVSLFPLKKKKTKKKTKIKKHTHTKVYKHF